MPPKLRFPHPGELLREEFLEPMGITQLALCKATGIPRSRLRAILAGRHAIDADTSERLGRYFGVGSRNWLNLQADYDERQRKKKPAMPKPRGSRRQPRN